MADRQDWDQRRSSRMEKLMAISSRPYALANFYDCPDGEEIFWIMLFMEINYFNYPGRKAD